MPKVTLDWSDDNTGLTGFSIRGSTTLQWPQDMPVLATVEPTVKHYEMDRQESSPFYMHVTAERDGQIARSQEMALTFPAEVMQELSVGECHNAIIGSIADNGFLGTGPAKTLQNGPATNDIALITKDGRFIYFMSGSMGAIVELNVTTGATTPLSQAPINNFEIRWAGLDSKGNIYALKNNPGDQELIKVNLADGSFTVVANLGSHTWTRGAIDTYNDIIYFVGGNMNTAGKIPVGLFSIANGQYLVQEKDTDASVTQAYGGWVGFAGDNSVGQVLIYWPGNTQHAIKIATRDMATTHHDMGTSYPNALRARNGVPVNGKIKFVGGGNIYTLDPATMAVTTATVQATINDINSGSPITWGESTVSATLMPNGSFLFLGAGLAQALVVKGDFTTGYTVSYEGGGFQMVFAMGGKLYALNSSSLWQMNWEAKPMMNFPDSFYSGLSAATIGRGIQ